MTSHFAILKKKPLAGSPGCKGLLKKLQWLRSTIQQALKSRLLVLKAATEVALAKNTKYAVQWLNLTLLYGSGQWQLSMVSSWSGSCLRRKIWLSRDFLWASCIIMLCSCRQRQGGASHSSTLGYWWHWSMSCGIPSKTFHHASSAIWWPASTSHSYLWWLQQSTWTSPSLLEQGNVHL